MSSLWTTGRELTLTGTKRSDDLEAAGSLKVSSARYIGRRPRGEPAPPTADCFSSASTGGIDPLLSAKVFWSSDRSTLEAATARRSAAATKSRKQPFEEVQRWPASQAGRPTAAHRPKKDVIKHKAEEQQDGPSISPGSPTQCMRWSRKISQRRTAPVVAPTSRAGVAGRACSICMTLIPRKSPPISSHSRGRCRIDRSRG